MSLVHSSFYKVAIYLSGNSYAPVFMFVVIATINLNSKHCDSRLIHQQRTHKTEQIPNPKEIGVNAFKMYLYYNNFPEMPT